jgi:phosphatidate cytidylyltransferase
LAGYNELTNLSDGSNSNIVTRITKCLVFTTAYCLTTLPSVLSLTHSAAPSMLQPLLQPQYTPLVCFALATAVIVMLITKLALAPHLTPSAIHATLSSITPLLLSASFLPITLPFLLLPSHYHIKYLLYPLTLISLNDTLAYVFGSLLGKNKLIPYISPGKTLEGYVYSGITSSIVGVYIAKYLNVPKVIGITTNVLVQTLIPFYGFLASAVKRGVSKKDFGRLLPGHGGVVDRIDCVVGGVFFVYSFLIAFGEV